MFEPYSAGFTGRQPADQQGKIIGRERAVFGVLI